MRRRGFATDARKKGRYTPPSHTKSFSGDQILYESPLKIFSRTSQLKNYKPSIPYPKPASFGGGRNPRRATHPIRTRDVVCNSTPINFLPEIFSLLIVGQVETDFREYQGLRNTDNSGSTRGAPRWVALEPRKCNDTQQRNIYVPIVGNFTCTARTGCAELTRRACILFLSPLASISTMSAIRSQTPLGIYQMLFNSVAGMKRIDLQRLNCQLEILNVQ